MIARWNSRNARCLRAATLFASGLGTFVWCGTVQGALLTWNIAGGGDFNTPSNWNPSGVPGVADTGIFDNNATGTVTFSANANPLDLAFRNTSGALTFDLGGTTLTMGNATTGGRFLLGAAAGQVNDVTLRNGSIVHLHTTAANLMQVGNFAGSNGNRLTITGNTTSMTSPSTAGVIAAVGIAGSNNNTLSVEDGANVVLRGSMNVGAVGATPGANNTLNVNSATFSLTGGARGINMINGTFNFTNGYSDLGFLLANAAGNITTLNFNSGKLYSRRTQVDNGRNFVIGDGGATPAEYYLAYSTATMTIGTTAAPADLVINSNGVLSGGGAGTITIAGSGTLRGNPGAKVMPSIVGQPVLTTDDRAFGTINLVGAWDNRNIENVIDVGDFPTAALPPNPFTPLDFINVSGAFTHGGIVSFNMAGFVPPPVMSEFKIIGWTSQVGTNASTSVQFLGGDPLPYRFDVDGLYLTVPEPATAALLAPLAVWRRRR